MYNLTKDIIKLLNTFSNLCIDMYGVQNNPTIRPNLCMCNLTKDIIKLLNTVKSVFLICVCNAMHVHVM